MDISVLKKRLSTFKSAQGHLRTINDDVILEVLRVWEQWPSSTAELYRELGIKKGQLSSLIRRAKYLVKNGAIADSDFKEIKIDHFSGQLQEVVPCAGVELIWGEGRIIRFSQVDLLLDFLKKAA